MSWGCRDSGSITREQIDELAPIPAEKSSPLLPTRRKDGRENSMKRVLKRIIRRAFEAGFDPSLLQPVVTQVTRVLQHPVDKGTQILLTLRYQELARSGITLPSLREIGFRSYSQNSEDGILLYIFALIGMTNRTVVELCAGDGIQCNAANLIINHQWHGLLFDGSAENISKGRRFYAEHPDTFWQPPVLVDAWITRDNINGLIEKHGFCGQIDLLSLDMDGMDYWVLRAIECIQPRVIVLETVSPWGAERSVTVPYQADFVAKFFEGLPYCGASLPAFVKLLKGRGYRLVGMEGLGFNAFFVLNGLGEDVLPEITAVSCVQEVSYLPEALRLKRAAALDHLRSLEYIEV